MVRGQVAAPRRAWGWLWGLAVGLGLAGSLGRLVAQAPPEPDRTMDAMHLEALANAVDASSTPAHTLPTLEALPSPAGSTPADASVAQTDAPGAPDVPEVSYAEAGIRPEQRPEPDMSVELDIGDEPAEGTTFHWVQIEGPAVTLPDPRGRTVDVEVPNGCERIAFLRIGTGPGRVQIVRFVVPIRGGPPPAPAAGPTATGTATGPLRADAGDDQVGLVGHRVTLNGSKSEPAEGLVYRWLQIGGPPILAPQQERAFFSFIPTNPGLYQFALVVGGRGSISEADAVSVLVGAAPAGPGITPAGPSAAPVPPPGLSAMPAAPTAPAAPAPEQVIGSAVPALADGPRLASEVADVFGAVAERAPLYHSFADLQSELVRRLDVVIPADPEQRLAWSQGVLQPLTQHTVERLLAVGLDVRQPAGLNQPLLPAQKERLRDHFQGLARAFESAARR